MRRDGRRKRKVARVGIVRKLWSGLAMWARPVIGFTVSFVFAMLLAVVFWFVWVVTPSGWER